MNDNTPSQEADRDEWSFEEAFEFTDANHERLRLRIKDLRDYPEIKKELTSRKLAASCHDKDVKPHTIDSFMREESIALGEQSHHDLVRYLADNHWLNDQWKREGAARDSNSLFRALTHFLQIHQQTINELADEASGTYVIWAPSLHIPGKYIRGRLEITTNDDAVRIIETHNYSGREGTTPLKEEFCGFIIKKSRHYVLFSRLNNGHSGPPRMIIIDNAISVDSKLMVMQGMATGCYGANTLFSAPIYIERWIGEPDELDRTIDITDDIPDVVRNKLSFTVSNNVLRF
ncbi:hypothetical protein AWB77_06305 [Caballeronia fortuita]|uniref:Uncharacterized protein n=1 Tax=Caballeronia fortuita TaxID=1777138 RepID=A0A158E3A5_9BURK|nr:hypothetical protein [Caballeronia fortuita]SAL01243.1 hypothetical protein AWB77_06305 [Caballeronia fortuita]